ncbi:MAG: alpha/beta fold hydrolase [Bacteroidota bacterium]
MNPILHSKILGEGPALLILHGFLGMSDNWKTLGSQFAKQGFQVHLIDQRNHGRSFHATDFDYELLAEDLKTYMDYYDLDSATVLGHSMGGKTAMQFAVQYPKQVQQLLVADIAPKYYAPHHQQILNALNQLDLTVISSRSEADTKLSEYLAETGIRQFLLKNLYRKDQQHWAFRFNLEVLQHKMEAVGAHLLGSHSYGGPTLFLRGGQSNYIQNDDLATLQTYFPKAQLVTIPNAGHWLHAERPAEFFAQAYQFINPQ